MRVVPGSILFGLLIGFLAQLITSDRDPGVVVTILLGVVLIAIGSLLRKTRTSRVS